MTPSDVDVPPGWKVDPSAPGQRAPVVALGLVGLAVSTFSALHARGIVGVWEPLLRSDESGWVRPAVEAPSPELDLVGFACVVATTLLGGRARWRTSPWLVGATALAVAFTVVSAVWRWSVQYASIGMTSTLFLLTAASAVAITPLVADEVYAALFRRGAVAPGTAARLDDDVGYVSGAGAILVGLWLLVAPLPTRAALHAHLLGAVVIAIGALSLAKVARSARWLNAALGALLMLSPLLVAYTLRGAIHMLVSGLLLLVVSVVFQESDRWPKRRRRTVG